MIPRWAKVQTLVADGQLLTGWLPDGPIVTWWTNSLPNGQMVTLETYDGQMVFKLKSDGLKGFKKKHICTIFLRNKNEIYVPYPNHLNTTFKSDFGSHLLPFFQLSPNFNTINTKKQILFSIYIKEIFLNAQFLCVYY
jgi:hypothetical protein